MPTPKDQDHADDPEPPDYRKRNERLRDKDDRVFEIDQNYGESEVDAEGDIADETQGHRN